MPNFGDTATVKTDLIINGSDATFMQDVIEASKQVPVIVDFWAPWCGPCKTLGPALEAAVTKAKGAVKMVKIDIDQNQMIVGQLRVQSIPTVYAFWQGQPIDGFQGALPQSQIDEFVKKIAGHGQAPEDGLDSAIDEALEILEQGDVISANEILAAVLQEEPENPRAYAGLISCYIKTNELDQAEAVLNGVPAQIAASAEIEAMRAQIALARQAENTGPLDDLRAAVAADPVNHQARFDLAVAFQAAGQTQDAVDELLTLFKQDRDWNDAAAKNQLFRIFDALKPNDPIVLEGRRKLSSLIFA